MLKLVFVNLVLVVAFYIGYEVIQKDLREFEDIPKGDSLIFKVSESPVSARLSSDIERSIEGCALKVVPIREGENKLKILFKELECDQTFMNDAVIPEAKMSHKKGCM